MALCALLTVAMTLPATRVLATEEGRAEIVYVTKTTVYLNAGSKAGLRVGERVDVMRDGELVDVLHVTAVSSHRASCKRAAEPVDVVAGDLVTFRPVDDGTVTPTSPSPDVTGSPSSSGWPARQDLRGRVAIRYLIVRDQSASGADFSQPAVDLRLDGQPHPSFAYSADVRTRRTYRSTPGAPDESRTRVYRLDARWGDDTGWRTVVGRQFATEMSAVGVFDGATLEYGAGQWRTGVFGGTQPDPVDFGFSSDIREHGAYVSWKSAATGRARWHMTGGFVGSYQNGEINREAAVLQIRFVGDRAFAYAIQEVDIHREWRSVEEGTALSVTSTFVSGRWRFTKTVAVDGGFDSRRNVRLYRDHVTPETEFDDATRRGYWGRFELRPLRTGRVSVALRRTEGGAGGDSESATFSGNASLGGPLRNTVRLRSTAHRNDREEGWLHSATLGAELAGRFHLAWTSGAHRKTPVGDAGAPTDLRWNSVDLDYRVSRVWLLLVSAERTDGDAERSTQVYTSAVWRF